jgi:4-amino-4-deoxychorismate lyase
MTLLALAQLGRGVVSVDTPILHADDEGVLRGRSVFETLRVYGGVPFMLDAHLDRLAASAARLRLPEPPRAAFGDAAFDAIAAGGELDATLRFLWTAGREGVGEPTGLALVSPLPPGLDELRARGLRVAVVRWAAGALAGAKSTSYAENMAAQAEAAERGADDALLVGGDGPILESTVLEAPTSNVWFREGDTLLTPSLALPLLAGVTRAALFRLAPQAGFTVEEGVFPLDRLLAADEVFLSSSVREVAPVVAIDGRPIPRGPAADALQDALRVAARYPDLA